MVFFKLEKRLNNSYHKEKRELITSIRILGIAQPLVQIHVPARAYAGVYLMHLGLFFYWAILEYEIQKVYAILLCLLFLYFSI